VVGVEAAVYCFATSMRKKRVIFFNQEKQELERKEKRERRKSADQHMLPYKSGTSVNLHISAACN
jgi:hypothetical protein